MFTRTCSNRPGRFSVVLGLPHLVYSHAHPASRPGRDAGGSVTGLSGGVTCRSNPG